MKRLSTILFALAISLTAFAQAPEGVNYQAVARDAGGDVLVSENLTVRMTIKESGPAGTTVYQETHSATTNDFGLFSLTVGQGSVVSGTFSNIDWGSASHFLQVEVDDGSGYVNLGTTQFVSVPYALYAKEAGNAGTSYSAGSGIDLTGNTISNTAPDQTVTLTGSGATTISGTYPNFTINSTDDNTTYSAGTGLNLSGTTFHAMNTNAMWNANQLQGNAVSANSPNSGEVLKWNGSAWAPANDVGGGAGDDWGSQVVQSDATLTGDGTSGNDLGLAQQGASSGEVLKWNGSTWAPATDNSGTSYSAGAGIDISGNTISNTGDTDASDDITTSTTAGGDLDGTYPDPSVIALQGTVLDASNPDDGDILRYSSGSDEWVAGPMQASPWNINGNDIFYDNGHVGIGTNQPEEILTVTDPSNHPKVLVSSSSGNDSSSFILSNFGSFGTRYHMVAQRESGLFFHTTSDLGGNTSENILVLTPSGEVGIGTSNPSEALDVDGNIDANGDISASGDLITGNINGVINAGGGLMDPDMNVISDGIVNNDLASGDEDLYINGYLEVDDDYRFEGIGTILGDSLLFDMNALDDLVIRHDGDESQIMAYGDWPTNGEIGSSTAPFYRIYSEDFYASTSVSYSTYSDSRIKENVEPLENSIDKISALNGVQYDLTEAHYNRNGEPRDKVGRFNHIGLIAQDVEEVFPELVKTNEETGLKTVGYMGLIPVLVEGMKQQQTHIESLEEQNAALQKQYEALEQRLSELESN